MPRLTVPALRRRANRALAYATPARIAVRQKLERALGRTPNLDDPQDLVEKIAWIKLNYLDPLMIDCSDKILVKDYIRVALGQDLGVPLIRRGLVPNDIRPERIAEDAFVLKVNHDSGGVMMCRDRDSFDWAGARAFFKKRLAMNFYWGHRETAYWPLRPEIFLEECLPKTPEAGIFDYKFFCFNGEPRLIQAQNIEAGKSSGRSTKEQAFYTPDWERQDLTRQHPPAPYEMPHPPRLGEMTEMVRTLSAPFAFVRIDFLYPFVSDRLYVGELTFYPSGGVVPFRPAEKDREFGAWLSLPDPCDPWPVVRGWQPGDGIAAFR